LRAAKHWLLEADALGVLLVVQGESLLAVQMALLAAVEPVPVRTARW
jgi:hypothetical protein